MPHAALLCVALITASPADDAKQVAQDILTKGAALFDTRNPTAIAATYTDDAEVSLITGGSGMGDYRIQEIRGRATIEQFYEKLFKERKKETQSKNTVEFAHHVGRDLLIIHGTFVPDMGKPSPVPFVQVRARRDGEWKIMSLHLFAVNDQDD